MLTTLRKNSLLDARLSQECSFVGACYEVLRIKKDMYPWAPVKMLSFSRGFSIWNLGHLFVLAQGDRWSNYQKFLPSCVRKNIFPQNYLQMFIQASAGDFIYRKVSLFHHNLSYCLTGMFKVSNYLEPWNLKKFLITRIFNGNALKMKAASSI